MTRLAIIGYGKMGQRIEQLAEAAGVEVVAICRNAEELRAAEFPAGTVAIEFTEPSAVIGNIELLAARGVSVVVGTTGWEGQRAAVEAVAARHNIGLLHDSNFSRGVQLWWRIVARAAELLDGATEYDIAIHESHHREKKDAPSGTALTTGALLLDGITRKTALSLSGTPQPHELSVSALRCGTIAGTHRVIADSAADTIEIVHTARNRDGFAAGAIECALWLAGRRGVFNATDCFFANKP